MKHARIFNNTFINTCVRIDDLRDTTGNILMNNAIYTSGGGRAVSFIDTPGVSLNTLFACNMVFGTIRNPGALGASFSSSQQGFNAFEGHLTRNYYPAANSELRGAGRDLSSLNTFASKDFNGLAHGSLWDIGAYQYDSAYPSNPGWVLVSLDGGFMDTVLSGGPALERFFAGFDRQTPLSLTVSPNPARGRIHVTFKGLTEAALYNPTHTVFLAVYDARGRLVRNLTGALMQSRTAGVSLEAGRLAPGAYFVRLAVGRRKAVQRMVISG
jgi:hypothetical protein